MNTKEISQEQISALIDGELSNAYVDMALVALSDSEGLATWDAYHQVGDILRSNDMAIKLSSEFNLRMFERLNTEPPMIVAPLVVSSVVVEKNIISNVPIATGTPRARRFALSGMAAAAAMAAVAFIAVPNMLDGNSKSEHRTMLSKSQLTLAPSSINNANNYGTQVVATSTANDEALRDSRIDEYLSAHQRFSLYSATEYARSATFAIDADN
ncbi:sigma-E factor negative regulatory protein [Glaciimonas sp. GG7]